MRTVDAQASSIELMQSAQQGEEGCLGRLLQRYANYLRVLSAAQLDPKLRGRVSPSDIVQETYVDAHRDFGKFRGATEQEFTAWLRQILIQNLARAVERHVLAAKRDVRRERSIEDYQRAIDRSSARLETLLVDPGKTPSAAMQERQRALEVADKLAALPHDYREVVILRNFQQLPFEEVATRMQRTPGAVRMLWMRALSQLREALRQEDA